MKKIGHTLVGVAAVTGTVAAITVLAVGGGAALLGAPVGAKTGIALFTANIGIAYAIYCDPGTDTVETTGQR